MDETRRQAYLNAMGIPLWQERDHPADIPLSVQHNAVDELLSEASSAGTNIQPAVDSDKASWGLLQQQVATCKACELHTSRKQSVFGVGNQQADLMIIGEAPGAEEDRLGEPFVGRAGQLLNAMLKAIGLSREQVYIANVVKCRPPGNRNPTASEAAACEGYLARQITLVQPRLLLSVGAVSAHSLLKNEEPVGRLRRQVHQYGVAAIPLLVTYHPAYLLRRPEEKAKAWEDLQRVAAMLATRTGK